MPSYSRNEVVLVQFPLELKFWLGSELFSHPRDHSVSEDVVWTEAVVAIMQLTLTDVAAIGGLTFGVAGLVLSIVNYLRDRSKLVVTLRWDMTISTTHEQVGVIRISNVGRRPAYVSHVALKMPKGAGTSHILLADGIYGKKLEEGSEPLVYPVHYDSVLKTQSAHWREIRAQVSDSTGKEWLSKKNSDMMRPSWAK